MPAPGAAKATPPLTPEKIPATLPNRIHAHRDVPGVPRFHVGQRVRARNIHPVGHTRLPRYARGKLGMVLPDHGDAAFPDTHPPFLRCMPHDYSCVRLAS